MGKNSKREEAQQALERRLQKQREEMERQKQQNRLIRNTMLVVLAVVVLAASIGAITAGIRQKKAKEESKYDLVSMTVSYTNANGEFCQGNIMIKLYEDIAPITVKNFRKLVSEKKVACYILNTGDFMGKPVGKENTLSILEAVVDGTADFQPWGPFSDIEIMELEGYVPDLSDEKYLSQMRARMQERLNYVVQLDFVEEGYNSLPTEAAEALRRVVNQAKTL